MHKKYTYKDGKRYGPYLYETRRVKGRIVTHYLGPAKNSPKKNIALFILVGIIAVLLLFMALSFGDITGEVTLDVKSRYKVGEDISGKLKLNFNPGELVPSNSKVIVSYDSEEKEFELSELLDKRMEEGSFYAEGTSISGEGEGYGAIGIKRIYPEVEFSLLIFEKDNEPEESELDNLENREVEEDSEENESDLNESETEIDNNQTDDENSENDIYGEEEKDDFTESEMFENDELQETESSEDEVISSNSLITGAVISENSGIIYGKTSKNQNFEYSIEKGQSAKLIGSVKSEGRNLDKKELKLNVKSNKVIVSTNYYTEERGFGEEYNLGKKSGFDIDLRKLDLVASNSSLLKIRIEYENNVIVEVEKDISVNSGLFGEDDKNGSSDLDQETNGTIEQNLSESNDSGVLTEIEFIEAKVGEPVKWKRVINVSEPTIVRVQIPLSATNVKVVQKKVESEFISDDSEENDLRDIQDGTDSEFVLDENVGDDGNTEENNLEDFEDFVDEEETEGINEQETEQESDEVTVTLTGNVISGKVTAEIEDYSENIIIEWIKSLFGTITGRAVDNNETYGESEEDYVELVVSVNDSNISVEVEYYTEAPEAIQLNLNERDKRVIVSGPDLGYTNIIAFAELDNTVSLEKKSRIKLYWYDSNISSNDSEEFAELDGISYIKRLVDFEAFDLDLEGNIDYIEWIVPHLSNQTYDIILITLAERLDSNRTFISDIYDEVSELDGNWSETILDGEYVRVSFERNLTNERDITVFPRAINGSPKIDIYEINGTEKVAGFDSLIDNEYNRVILTGLVGEQDSFDLRIQEGSVEFDHIIDPLDGGPDISFVLPSPDNDSTQLNNDIYINLSTSDNSEHYSFVDFNRDLLVWLRMDDTNASGDPVDLSSYSFGSKLQPGGVINSTGRFGDGAHFTGAAAGGYILVGNTTDFFFDEQSNFTFSIWFNSKINGNNPLIDKFGQGGVSTYLTTSGRVSVQVRNTSNTLATINSLTNSYVVGQWHHAVFVFRENELFTYVDGSIRGSGNFTVNHENILREIRVGYRQNNGWYFNGSLDEVVIINRSLTETEVFALYNSSAYRYEKNFTGLPDPSTNSFVAHATDSVANRSFEELTVFVNSSYVGAPEEEVSSCRELSQNNTYYNLTTDLSNTGSCIKIIGSNITLDLKGFNLTGDLDSSNDIGINVTETAHNVTIKNGLIDGFGVGLDNYANDGTFINLTIKKLGAFAFSASMIGIRSSGERNNFINNSLDTLIISSLSSSSHGFYLNGETDSVVLGNLVKNVSSATGYGVNIVGGEGLIIKDNIVRDIKTTGIIIGSSSQNVNLTNISVFNSGTSYDLNSVSNVRIVNGSSNNTSGGNAILISNGADEIYLEDIQILNTDSAFYDLSVSLDSNQRVSLVNMVLGNYSFGGSTGPLLNINENGKGEIRLLSGVTASGNNFSSDVQISDNYVFVDSVTSSGLNKSANITLYNSPAPGDSPVILRDGILCPSSICYNYTSLTAETVIFNVTGWSNYSLGESTNITGCRTLGLDYATYEVLSNISSTGTCLQVTGTNITINGNGYTLIGNNASGHHGINATGIANITIKDYTIKDFASSVTGSAMSDGVVGSSGDGADIVLENSFVESVFSNGFLSNAGDIRVIDSRITKNLSLDGTENNNVFGVGFNGGIAYFESDFINLSNIKISLDFGPMGSATAPGQAGRLILNYSDSFEDTGTNYSTTMFLHIVNRTAGDIVWYNNLSLYNLGNINLDDNFALRNNYLYVNSSSIQALNKSANVTFYNMPGGFTYPVVLKDGFDCINSECYNYTSLNSATVVFNVSGFSNYSIGETKNPLYACGETLGKHNSVYNLMNNVSGSSSCFTIAANNVTFEGNGYSITGDDSGGASAINANGRHNLTIRDVDITDYFYGVFFSTVEDSLVENGVYNSTSYGVYLDTSHRNTVQDIKFISTAQRAIRIYRDSSNNLITNNNFTGGQYSAMVEYWSVYSPSDNNIINNEFSGESQYSIYLNNAIRTLVSGNRISSSSTGVGLATGGSGNVINNNTITGVSAYGIYSTTAGGSVISNNTVTGAGNYNLRLSTSAGNNLTGNTLSGATSYDLYVSNSQNNRFTDNYIGTYNLLITENMMVFASDGVGELAFTKGINGSGTNLSDDIKISFNYTSVNSNQIGLNRSANVTFYGMTGGFSNATVVRDGLNCPESICFNLTDLNASTVKFNVTGFSSYWIGEYNYPPEDPNPEIRTIGFTNLTTDTLYCRDNVIIDPEGEDMNVSVRWYNNSVLHLEQDFSGYANGTTFEASLEPGNTTAGESWSCGIRLFDGASYSNWVNSTNLTIIELDVTPPNLEFVPPTPDNASSQSNSDIYLNLSSSDNNGEHYSFADFDNSLVGWYRLGDNQNSSDDVIDELGRNNGTVVQATLTSAGAFGGAFDFDGAGDYVNFGTGNDFNITEELTLSIWFKASAVHQGSLIYRGIDSSGDITNYGLRTYNHGGALKIQPRVSNGSLIVGSLSGALEVDRWYHAVVVFNGKDVLNYINGTLATNSSFASQTKINSNEANLDRKRFVIGAHGSLASVYLNGSIDEVLIFNRSLSGAEIASLYSASANQYQRNFTGLSEGSYVFTGYAVDTSGNMNSTEEYEVELVLNAAPNNPTPELNSTDLSNRTAQNLHGFDVLSDDNADAMNVSVRWFKNNVLNLSLDYNNSYSNGTLFVATLDSGNTTKGDEWIFSIRLFDGTSYSDWVNSSSLTILNSLPVVTLSSPPNNNVTTDRTPTFEWNALDDDGDSLGYELNITCNNGCTAQDSRYIQDILTDAHTLDSDLQFLFDNGYYYNWSVRANDSEGFGLWTDERRLNVESLLIISLPVSSVNFGVINFEASNDTTNDSPLPFVVQNDGNAFVNVTVKATNLWNTQANPNEYYRFKADNFSGEEGAFLWSSSLTSFTNMFADSNPSPAVCIADLNYLDVNDVAEVDIYVEVPPNEGSDARGSVVTFTASLSE